MILALEDRVIPEIFLHGLEAIEQGRIDLLLPLLETGLSTTLRDHRQRTLLHHAAKFGNPAVLLLLLNRGAQVNAVDEQQWTPLHVAAERGFMEVVDLLVKNGAACDVVTGNGTTALHYLCTHAYSAHEMLMLRPLFNKFCNVLPVDVVNDRQETPLHYVFIGKGTPNLVELLLELGADPERKTIRGYTPLKMARLRHRTECISILESALRRPRRTIISARTLPTTISVPPARPQSDQQEGRRFRRNSIRELSRSDPSSVCSSSPSRFTAAATPSTSICSSTSASPSSSASSSSSSVSSSSSSSSASSCSSSLSISNTPLENCPLDPSAPEQQQQQSRQEVCNHTLLEASKQRPSSLPPFL